MYVIAEPCIGSKDQSCVEVCPVDCIHPTSQEPGFDQATQLYIDPEECIDCGACEGQCPVEAIFRGEDLPAKWESFAQLNSAYYDRRTSVSD
jgi:ferredoxin